jgi:hypothetical protein
MNRSIEFRGKAICDDKWVTGFLVRLTVRGRDIIYRYPTVFNNGIPQYLEVKPSTVGEFTGLYDEVKWTDLTEEERGQWTLDGNMPSEWKGHKVYEGDQVLLNIKEIGVSEREVIFTNGSFALCGDKGNLSLINIDGEQYKIMRVLYNIHDNKLPTVTLST